MEERNAKTKKDYKCVEVNPCQKVDNFVWDSGGRRKEVCGSRKKIRRGRRGSKKKNETSQGKWLRGARTGSLWFCYTRSLAGK